MAWMPGVDTSRKANDTNSTLSCSPNVVCAHTIVGYAPALAAHFSVRADGYIWQHRDTNRQSAANYQGNAHVISIETEDHGSVFGSWSGSNVPAWTGAQIEAIAKIAAWACQVHSIPLVQLADSKRSSAGIGFHRQGIDGNFSNGRIPGGELWSASFGKVCPGDRRISQMSQVISRAREISGLGGGNFLAGLSETEQRNLYNRIFGMLRQRWFVTNEDGTISQVNEGTADAQPASVLDSLDGNYIVNRILDVDARLEDLEEKVAQLSTPQIDVQVDVDEAAIALAVAQQINLHENLTPEQLRLAVEQAVLNVVRTQWNK
jgi:hypothetical protein